MQLYSTIMTFETFAFRSG